MNRPLLILRPQPGADETAARARVLGLEPVVAPLFTVRPLAWEPPDPADFDAVLLTSANAAREAGPALSRFTTLPCWAVGEATAAAAQEVGFADVRTGSSDGTALVQAAAASGISRVLHLHGREHVALAWPGLEVESRAVYAAEAAGELPEAARGLRDPVALIHSPRAGARFAALAGEKSGTTIAAISRAAAAAAGSGWAEMAVAAAPRDEALLELAVKLCQNRPARNAGAGGAHGL
ncbi:MAG TPA: uroporphyrinogen-III synthase [Allosphingosinicella sp.]|nr:uroporphyrinogen-III synthase [Allosphingosinicella sp.]